MTEPALAEDDLPHDLASFRAWRERQPGQWEFLFGRPRLMAPGSKAHTVIKTNIVTALSRALEGTPCRALTDGAELEVEGASLLPDAVVTCSPLDFATPVVAEPVIVVEVMSPSSERDDTHRKLDAYLRIPSLRHYLVIFQDKRRILHYQRQDAESGVFVVRIAGEPVALDPPGVTLRLDDIYRDVPLEPTTAQEAGPA